MLLPHLSALWACFVLSRRSKNFATDTFVPDITSRSIGILSSAALADIADVATETPADKYDLLLEWLKSNGSELNENLCFKPSLRGGDLGAFVTKDVAMDEVLVTIPRKVCLTIDDVKSDPESGEIFKKLMEQAGNGGNTVALAGVLAKERLLAQAKGPSSSRFGPYLDTLPWSRGINNQEHMLFWSDDDVETLLKGTMGYSEATALREEVSLAINALNKIIGRSILVARGELSDTEPGFRFPWQQKQEPLQGLVEGLPEAVRGAFVCLLTRAFQDGDEEDDGEKLVPWLDMLQVCDNLFVVFVSSITKRQGSDPVPTNSMIVVP